MAFLEEDHAAVDAMMDNPGQDDLENDTRIVKFCLEHGPMDQLEQGAFKLALLALISDVMT